MYIIRQKLLDMRWLPVFICSIEIGKAKEAAEESLKLNNTLIDYIDLGAKGGPTKVTTMPKAVTRKC